MVSTTRKLVYSALTVFTAAAVFSTFTSSEEPDADKVATSADDAAAGAGGSTTSTRASSVVVSAPLPKGLTSRMFPKVLPGEISRARAAPDGKGNYLVIGGLDYRRQQVGLITRVNPNSFTRETAGSLALPTSNHGAALLNGKVVVVGGGLDASAGVKSSQSFEGAGTAKIVGDLGAGRYGFGTAVVGDRMIIVGGGDNRGDNLNVVATRDGTSFEQVAKLDVGIRYPAVAALGSKVYAMGGEVGGKPVASVYEIDVGSGKVTKLPTEIDVATSHAAGFELNGAVFMAGGKTESGPTDRVWRLDPLVPTFLIGGILPTPRFDSAAVVVSGRAFVIGGENVKFLQEIVEFTPTVNESELFAELSRKNSTAVPLATQPKSPIETVPRSTVVITRPKQ